ncbi:MAG: aminotransferase class V-fold PLP-dependent enzyme [Clostridiales bacterium]|nr:aminotransferase class V-fold PLP-dependent enzyme [Clostridiales bacterium]
MIYLDNAATTLIKPPTVAKAVLEAMQTLGNTARGAHSGSMNAARTVYDTRVKLAELFNCKRADHVVFTGNVTESLNIAINGVLSKGDHVISTDLEHNSVLRPLYRLQTEWGIEVDFVRSDTRGNLNYNDFQNLIKPNTKAIVCTHASNLTGNITDIKRVSEVAHAHNILLIVDAAQTAGTQDIDMQQLGIDILCFTGHKGLMGPQGTGGMCIGENIKIRPFIVGGTGVQTYSKTQPDRLPTLLEAGTLNSHGIAGLSAAVDFINETGLKNIQKKEALLTQRFYIGVKRIKNVTVYGNFEREHAAIVTLNIGDMDSGEVADILFDKYDIATRAGAHCAPRLHEALGTKEQGAVRFSFSFFNTEDDIDKAICAINDLATVNKQDKSF